ncbi:MAG TPA: IS1634 family transposase [Candidatus Paceibacterota bacterium]|nr:IS1634 family transposase [Candidatus Paceibacterota bacterium]
MDNRGLQSQRLDHLGIVAGICNEIGLIETIDGQLPDSKRKVSVGQAVQAMVLNGLGFVSRPLYLSPEFFHNKPADLLVGAGLDAADFNDDCLGRALEQLFKQGVTEVFATVSAKALQTFGIETQFAHLDSTSISVHGAYESNEADVADAVADDGEPVAIHITHGYSRDQRPDLKQAMVSLMCANQTSLPMWLRVLDGNASDNTSFAETIQAYLSQFSAEDTLPVFVADAALYNEKTLQQLCDTCRIVTRVPATLKAVKDIYAQVDNEALWVADEETRYMEFGAYYAGIKQRWLLVLHDPSRLKQDQSLQQRVDKERLGIDKKLETLQNRDFGCADAVHKAVAALTKTWRYHGVDLTLYTEKRYQQAGRPAADAPFELVWRFRGEVRQDEAVIEQYKRSHGKYIIASNELNESKLGLLEMLALYKSQTSSVERGFRFLKDPLFFADSLFLKKPARIMALLMVMGLSLLVYALAEHRVRTQLAERDTTIPDQTGKPTQRPTMRRIFQMMEGVDLLIIEQARRRRLLLNMTDVRWQIIDLFGHHVRKFYSEGR